MTSCLSRKICSFVLLLVILFTLFNNTYIYADPIVPQIIRIGLSYNNNANNNFVLKSDSGMKISIKSGTGYLELFNFEAVTGLKIRKDAYYNIINDKEIEIDYVKAAKYSGELAGPYHIQIGDIYPDISSAKQIADSMISLTQSAYLVYDQGWRVWAQLYLDEGECLEQIQVFQKEMPNYTYSVVAPDKKRIQLFDTTSGQLLYIINAEQDIRFDSIPAANKVTTVAFGSSKYRGSICLKRIPTGPINAINVLPFEEYLYGVVPAEVYTDWHIEALKAQAVSARSYGMYSMGKHTLDGFDLCSGQHCQAYKGYSIENQRTNQAVDETKGKLVLYNDKLVAAYFHSSSGGRTENSENIWVTPLPYIKAVDDKYGLGSPYDNWTKQYNKSDIKDKLLANHIDIGDIIDIVPLEVSANGRVTLLEIRGTKDKASFVKEKIRSIMGSSEIRSIWYTLTTDADIFVKDRNNDKPNNNRAGNLYVLSAAGMQKLSSTSNKVYIRNQTALSSSSIIPEKYVFTGKGWGHGLGLSQYGAKGMAEAGFNFIQILEYYFTGAKVK